MTIRISLILAMLLTALVGVSPQTAVAAGSGGGSAPIPTRQRGYTPEQMSAKVMRAGIKHRDRALKHEQRAAKASSEKARTKSLAKAQKEYGKAIKKQAEALNTDPQNYKAANELGFAYRKTGQYRKAIAAYNFSLEINPKFYQATEYRGEALLALGHFDLTRRAYMTLFRNDRELASQLMASFDKWAADKSEPTADEQAFLTWVAERKRLAEMADKLSLNTPRSTAQQLWPSF